MNEWMHAVAWCGQVAGILSAMWLIVAVPMVGYVRHSHGAYKDETLGTAITSTWFAGWLLIWAGWVVACGVAALWQLAKALVALFG